jgi:signal transduction histidine kinase
MAIESTSTGRTTRDEPVGAPEVVPSALLREREARLSWPDLYHLQRLAEGGLLAAGLAHDVGNLLSAISGWCQIAGTALDPAHRAAAAARAGDLATRTAAKVKTFLTFARAYVPPACRVALPEVVGDAVALVRTARPGLEVRWRAPEGPVPALLGPRTLLLQTYLTVMLGLTPPEPGRSRSLQVRAEPRGSFARVEIDEQGPRLREPVYLAQPRPDGGPARGALGLESAQALVRDLGGRMGSEPLVPHGVRVWVELPAASECR